MTTPHFAVFGHPVAHSLSPQIHAAFGKQTGIALDYRAIAATREEFAPSLRAFSEAGGRGANITLPHKEAAFALCIEVSEQAKRAGAVNTLTHIAGGWRGDNTDGMGLVRDLTDRAGFDLRARRTLLLGAGGAARGVAQALLDAGVAELVIVNRTPEKADALADSLADPERANSRYWEDLAALGDFELLVNATSAGREPGALKLPGGLIAPRSLAVDLSYGEAAIAFTAWARAHRVPHVRDGLGMLVEQAASSFEIWHGRRPETETVFLELAAKRDRLSTAD
ncbi:MAG: shikimate dehydrogenase [Pseudomarimonas sp.]